MNTLSVNLHLMLVSFYRPDTLRNKIIIEGDAFPSDIYAVESHIRHHGLDPSESLIKLKPRRGEVTIRLEDVKSVIQQNADSVSLIMLGGVNYYTGQVFEMKEIAEEAHKHNILVGFDLAHAVGNIPLSLHDWNVDFPHLMLRAKAIQFKKGETKLSHKVLTSPQKLGAIASKPVISPIVNWSNKNKTLRKVTQTIMGVHEDAVVPKYHSKNLSKLFVEEKIESEFKVAIFGTCYGEYNDPKTVIDLVDVLRHNKVEVKLVNKAQCCGMPKMELGDLESVVKYANANIDPLIKLVKEGYKLIAPIPSCVCLLYTSPSPRDQRGSGMPSSA